MGNARLAAVHSFLHLGAKPPVVTGSLFLSLEFGNDGIKDRFHDQQASTKNSWAAEFTRDLGAIPELDSMAVVSLITSPEDQFGLEVDDDDIDGSTFATVGSLADFVSAKIAG